MNKINKIISKKNYIYFLPFALLFGLNIFYLLLNKLSLNGQGFMDFKEVYDNVHYITISQKGYVKNSLYAFFPFIPILISIFGIYGMLILNHILSFLNLFLLIYLSKNVYNKTNREVLYIAILFICSPIQIFAYTLYTEPLFLFLSLLTIIIYKQKNNVVLLGIVVGISLLVRSFGFSLFMSIVICFVVDYVKSIKTNKISSKKIKNKLVLFIFFSCSIGALYPLFLYYKTGSLFTFVSVQTTNWCRISTSIFSNFILGFQNTFFSEPFERFSIIIKLILSFEYIFWVSLCFVFIYKVFRNLKMKNYELFDILNLAFTLLIIGSSIRNTETPYCSYYRYYLSCYSFYILFSNAKENKKVISRCFLPSILFLSQVVIFVYYFNSYYFY